MRRLFLVLTALLAIAAVLPMVASAQDNSAIDEYIEGVPEGGGEQPSDEQGGGGGGAPGSGGGEATPLPPGTSQDLESEGASGAAAAALAEATAPSGPRERGAAEGNFSRDDEDGPPSVGDVVGGIAGGSAGGSDSGGLGTALPIILGAALLAALAVLVARRLRNSGDTNQV